MSGSVALRMDPRGQVQALPLAWGARCDTPGLVLTLLLLVGIVTLRFFTEILGWLPRWAQFPDMYLIIPFFAYAAIRPPWSPRAAWGFGIGGRLLAFGGVCALSVAFNLDRVSLYPAVLFLYGTMAPLVYFVAVARLCGGRGPVWISRTFYGLGLLQLGLGLCYCLPRLVATGNPDVVSGTFGFNAYQYTAFLGFWLFGVIGDHLWRRSRPNPPTVGVMLLTLGLVFVLFCAAQYRSMLIFFPLAMVATLVLGRTPGTGVVGVGVLALLVGGGALYGVNSWFPGLKLAQALSWIASPGSVAEAGKIVAFRKAGALFLDHPSCAILGSGPGTYGSRGFLTFSAGPTGRATDVAGEYVSAVTGKGRYMTDVAERYIYSVTYTAIQGGWTAANPWTSYISVPVETGLLGALILFGAYGAALRFSLRVGRRREAAGDRLLYVLSFTCTGSLLLLAFQCLFDNWIEVTRVTIPLWVLLAALYARAHERALSAPPPAAGGRSTS